MGSHHDHRRQHEAVAAAQFGAFTGEQAAVCGFSPTMQHDRRRRGDWIPVLPGVMRLASTPVSFRQRAMAAALWSRPDGLISHTTAGVLWGLEGVARTPEVHLLVPRGRGLRHESVVVHQTADLLPADAAARHGIPVTSALRTVLDFATMLTLDRFELAIEDALRRGLFTVGQLEWRHALRGGKGVAGSSVVAELVARHGSTVTDSGWEVRVERVLVAAGFAPPVRQLGVDTAMGRLRVDLGYPGPPAVAFEYDSDRWHSGVQRRHADMAKRNALRAAGVVVVEVNASILRDQSTFVATVRRILAATGASCDEQSSWCPSVIA